MISGTSGNEAMGSPLRLAGTADRTPRRPPARLERLCHDQGRAPLPRVEPEVTVSLFVLVHGAYHGGWCWSRLIPELERLGHRAIAPDLPCDDPAAGYDEYVAAVLAPMDAATASTADVVVVGH